MKQIRGVAAGKFRERLTIMPLSIHAGYNPAATSEHESSARATTMDLESTAETLAQTLAEKQKTLVLAESCTGGLIAATLATVPGISSWFAGSFVVYQEESKTRWLGVDQETLAEQTAVSAPVAHQMVAGALKATPQADIAAAVTGHLGPGAPEELDGVVFLALMCREQRPKVRQIQLSKTKRVARQRETAQLVTASLIEMLG